MLTKADDPEWQFTCLAIIEFFTKLWGGHHAIVVPTNGESIDDTFWALLSAHDPDVILVYQKTGEDLRRSRPIEFDGIVDREIEKATRAGCDSETAKVEIPSALSRQLIDQFAVSDDLWAELMLRLAPLHFDAKPWPPNTICAGSPPFSPLTASLDVVGEAERERAIIDVSAVGNITVPPLWLAASIGWSTPAYFGEMSTKGNLSVKPVTPDEPTLVWWGFRGYHSESDLVPLDLCKIGLTSARSRFARTFEQPTVLVLGDSIQDFCLYYGLRRLHGRALWIPSRFIEEVRGASRPLQTAFTVAQEFGNLNYSKECVIASTSHPISELKEFVHRAPKNPFLSLSAASVSVSFVAELVQYPIRTYVQGRIEKVSTHQLVDDELPGPFESLRPDVLKGLNPQKHRWIVEIAFRKHSIPRHPGLGAFVVADPNLGEANTRTSNEGAAYLCPGSLVVGEDVDYNLVRPIIRVPNAHEIFRRVLGYCGYICDVSDKGRYSTETINKFGGIEAAGAMFSDPSRRALLEKFLDRSKPGKGVYDEGLVLKDDRRYLNFAAISKVLGTSDHATEALDDLISKQVFYRGFIFKCGHCSYVDWFSVDEVTYAFACRRCGRQQQYTKSSWKHPYEPSWFYKLDEIVYLALRNDSAVPILTLNALRKKCKESFLFCPELQIWPQGPPKGSMELDICCILDGRLCVGEAKSNGTLEANGISASVAAEKYCDAATRLGASTVVFGTSAEKWDTKSDTAIDLAFSMLPHVKVLKWAAHDL